MVSEHPLLRRRVNASHCLWAWTLQVRVDERKTNMVFVTMQGNASLFRMDLEK